MANRVVSPASRVPNLLEHVWEALRISEQLQFVICASRFLVQDAQHIVDNARHLWQPQTMSANGPGASTNPDRQAIHDQRTPTSSAESHGHEPYLRRGDIVEKSLQERADAAQVVLTSTFHAIAQDPPGCGKRLESDQIKLSTSSFNVTSANALLRDVDVC